MEAAARDKLIGWSDALEQQARDKIMAFWLQHGIDEECGGYWTQLARDGSRYGDGEKALIVQMRTIYSMCLAHTFFGEQRYLDLAAHGVDFVRRHFRDEQYGGWHYRVSRDGQEVLDDSKQPYALAFVSYGLAEYARLTKDQEALQDAIATHELVMEKCWDHEHGGLPNKFTADWHLTEGIKRVDTLLHTMEGVSALYHATGDAAYRARLAQLVDTVLGDIGVNGCYDRENGCTHEMFYMDWSEAMERTKGLCNYGHVTEAGWFIAKVAAYTGDAEHQRRARGLLDWAIAHGFDREYGGLFMTGQPDGTVVEDRKIWWNQAELLGALAFLVRQTQEEAYVETLETHLAYIEGAQLDAEYGEWYPTRQRDGSLFLSNDGTPDDRKGSPWKSPYHVMQGLYHAYRDLRRAAGVETVSDPPRWDDYCL